MKKTNKPAAIIKVEERLGSTLICADLSEAFHYWSDEERRYYLDDEGNVAGFSLREQELNDLSIFDDFNLSYLSLTINLVKDLSPLMAHSNLEHLYLGDNKIEDLSPLSGLTKLKALAIWKNPVTDLSHLKALLALERLICRNKDITDWQFVRNLTKLKHFSAPNSNIYSIDFLGNCKLLEDLNLDGNNISDVNLLTTFKKLHTISLVCIFHQNWPPHFGAKWPKNEFPSKSQKFLSPEPI